MDERKDDVASRPVIHVLGNFTWDVFDGETKKVLGGPPRFQAPLLSRLGFKSCLHSRLTSEQKKIMNETFPPDVLNNIITDYLVLSDQATVFRHLYDNTGERTSFLLTDAGNIPLPSELHPHFTSGSTHTSAGIILSPVFHELNPRDILAISSQISVPLFLDPQGFLRDHNPETTKIIGRFFWNARLLSSVDMIKVSSEEVSFLRPHKDKTSDAILNDWNKDWDAPTIHRRIIEASTRSSTTAPQQHSHPTIRLKMVILTKGNKGAELSVIGRNQNGQRIMKHYMAPAFPTTVENPTGAGDAFLVGFIHGWHVSKNVKSALAEANAVASIQISTQAPPDVESFKKEVKRRSEHIQPCIQHREIPLE